MSNPQPSTPKVRGILLPIAKLRKLCDPLKDTPWVCLPFGRREIAESLKVGLFESRPVADYTINCWPHVNRIAYFVRNGWSDPIEISVGVLAMGAYVEWPVVDGNHRLAAAIYRGDKTILATLDGSLEFVLAVSTWSAK